MRLYEAVYIFDAALDEAAINEHLEKFHALAVRGGGELVAVDHWGNRQLAYPVAKKKMGYYVVAQFRTDPSALPEFERIVKLDESLMRYLVVLNEGEPTTGMSILAQRPPKAESSRDEDEEDRTAPVVSISLGDDATFHVGGLRRSDPRQRLVLRSGDVFVLAGAARLATEYLEEVDRLVDGWRGDLAATTSPPRADAAAWAIIDILPAHPMITAPVAAAATNRSKPQIYHALKELESAGILISLTAARRNQSWEAAGLLDLLAGLEAGRRPEVDEDVEVPGPVGE